MKLSDMVQGSLGWLDFRSKGIGGSDIGTVLGLNPYKTEYQLWEEKCGLRKPDDLSKNPRVARGQRLENTARLMAQVELNLDFEPEVYQHDNFNFLKASLDGITKDGKYSLEIKCPSKKTHEDALNLKLIQPYYYAQCQHNLLVSGSEKLYYVSYNPDYEGDQFCIIEVLPDQQYHENIIKHAAIFWNKVLKRIEPELSDRDFLEVKDLKFKELVESYSQMKKELEALELKVKESEEQIKGFTNSPRFTGFGIKVQEVHRKGAIDYSKVPELKDVDLEQYRKQPTSYKTIKHQV